MKVTIYGKPNCPNCVKAKNLCATKPAIEVEYIDIVEQGIDAVKLGEICGTMVREVPQIFVDDKHVGGWTALMPHVTQYQG